MSSEEDLAIDVLDHMGVRVRCTRDRWSAKIERIHQELAGREAEIASALQRPDMVFRDRDRANRSIFIRNQADGRMIFVVVE